MAHHFLVFAVLALATAPPVAAQTRSATAAEAQDDRDDAQRPLRANQTGEIGQSAVGRVGVRQDQTTAAPNVRPLARISSRLETRVNTRIRNRVDRFYDPAARTTDAFIAAEDQARSTRGR